MRSASLLLVALLLSACGGLGGLGSLGDILGSPSTSQPSDVRGTVEYVDTSAQRIDLNVTHINNLRDDRTQRGAIYYDSRTRVLYQNREYRVTDLERGDEVSVTGVNDNGRYVAQTITVLRNIRG
jgi:hypothetical protein